MLENMGWLNSCLLECYNKDASTITAIQNNMAQCRELWSLLSEFEGNSTYDAVDHIKVIVKQLTGHIEPGITNIEARVLTQATTKALKLICDGVMGVNSKLHVIQDQVRGSIYIEHQQFIETGNSRSY